MVLSAVGKSFETRRQAEAGQGVRLRLRFNQGIKVRRKGIDGDARAATDRTQASHRSFRSGAASRILPASLRQMDRARPIRVSVFGRALSHVRRSVPRRGATVTVCVAWPIVPYAGKYCADARLASRRLLHGAKDARTHARTRAGAERRTRPARHVLARVAP